jgi:hypothetical protein
MIIPYSPAAITVETKVGVQVGEKPRAAGSAIEVAFPECIISLATLTSSNVHDTKALPGEMVVAEGTCPATPVGQNPVCEWIIGLS